MFYLNDIMAYFLQGNQTSLHVASMLGNCELITVLLQSGANVQAVTRDGHSALHVATKAGHDEAVSLLLNSGAQPDILTKVRSID